MICGDHTPFVGVRWGHHLNLAKNTDCTGLLKENAKQGPSTRTLGKQNADALFPPAFFVEDEL